MILMIWSWTWKKTCPFIGLQYQLFWVLIYFDDTLLDRSDGSQDVIVVTEEGVKEVEKPHTEVSPAQLCVGIYLHHIRNFQSAR